MSEWAMQCLQRQLSVWLTWPRIRTQLHCGFDDWLPDTQEVPYTIWTSGSSWIEWTFNCIGPHSYVTLWHHFKTFCGFSLISRRPASLARVGLRLCLLTHPTCSASCHHGSLLSMFWAPPASLVSRPLNLLFPLLGPLSPRNPLGSLPPSRLCSDHVILFTFVFFYWASHNLSMPQFPHL